MPPGICAAYPGAVECGRLPEVGEGRLGRHIGWPMLAAAGVLVLAGG